MLERFERVEKFLVRLIERPGADQGHGRGIRLLLWLLHQLSRAYRFVVVSRVFLYRKGIFRHHALGCQVISVGEVQAIGSGGQALAELATGGDDAPTLVVSAGSGTAVVAARGLERHELQSWLWETWRFVKQIFPLLVVGVFGAGMVKVLIPEQWIQTLAGSNTIWANLMGVLFGVFMYFPTLVEVPIARMFLELGMHRGPLLAYLMADPELSLQSILVTGKILGSKKTWTYVSLVTVFSTLAGYIFGLALTIV